MKQKAGAKSETWRSGRKGGRVVYPQITRAARELGVTRVHLYLVLQGQRESASLVAKYAAWVVGEKTVGRKTVGSGQWAVGSGQEDEWGGGVKTIIKRPLAGDASVKGRTA